MAEIEPVLTNDVDEGTKNHGPYPAIAAGQAAYSEYLKAHEQWLRQRNTLSETLVTFSDPEPTLGETAAFGKKTIELQEEYKKTLLSRVRADRFHKSFEELEIFKELNLEDSVDEYICYSEALKLILSDQSSLGNPFRDIRYLYRTCKSNFFSNPNHSRDIFEKYKSDVERCYQDYNSPLNKNLAEDIIPVLDLLTSRNSSLPPPEKEIVSLQRDEIMGCHLSNLLQTEEINLSDLPSILNRLGFTDFESDKLSENLPGAELTAVQKLPIIFANLSKMCSDNNSLRVKAQGLALGSVWYLYQEKDQYHATNWQNHDFYTKYRQMNDVIAQSLISLVPNGQCCLDILENKNPQGPIADEIRKLGLALNNNDLFREDREAFRRHQQEAAARERDTAEIQKQVTAFQEQIQRLEDIKEVNNILTNLILTADLSDSKFGRQEFPDELFSNNRDLKPLYLNIIRHIRNIIKDLPPGSYSRHGPTTVIDQKGWWGSLGKKTHTEFKNSISGDKAYEALQQEEIPDKINSYFLSELCLKNYTRSLLLKKIFNHQQNP